MLVVGCDIGSETHYLRAIDTRGRELSTKAFPFSNTAEGFASAKAWLLELAARHGKTQIVVGLEPTGHYWFCLASWLVSNGISVVQVNPYAVKQTKELEDNSQRMLRDQLTEDRIRAVNRLHRELTICFPEYKDAFGKVDGAFTMALLKTVPFPADLKAIGADGIREIWHAAKLRGRGYSRAEEIIRYAEQSVGLQDGVDGSRTAVIWFAEQIASLDQKLAEIEEVLHAKCHELPCAENLLEIPGVGGTILAGIVAEMGDLSRFDTAKEIQKLSGLGLVACSSGKHKGETKISHRGRKRLRYWLFQAAKSVTAHTAEFKELHAYYTTRENNPLKKMQSLVVIACKLLRIIFAIFKNGTRYNPEKMLRDIRRQTDQAIASAA